MPSAPHFSEARPSGRFPNASRHPATRWRLARIASLARIVRRASRRTRAVPFYLSPTFVSFVLFVVTTPGLALSWEESFPTSSTSRRRESPSAEQATQQDQLAEVVCVVVGGEEQLLQDRRSLRVV